MARVLQTLKLLRNSLLVTALLFLLGRRLPNAALECNQEAEKGEADDDQPKQSGHGRLESSHNGTQDVGDAGEEDRKDIGDTLRRHIRTNRREHHQYTSHSREKALGRSEKESQVPVPPRRDCTMLAIVMRILMDHVPLLRIIRYWM